MEVADLTTFAAVARCAGITRAARELHTVQSNVTNRIKALEEEVGVRLFERHSRGVVLTSAGQRLLPYAARAVALLQEATAIARDEGEAQGTLNIGTMETTVATRLPEVLGRFAEMCPAVDLVVQAGPTAELVQKVLDNLVDGAFVAGPIDHPDLVAERAFEEELVLVTSRRWQNLAALRNNATPISALMFRTGCSYRQRLEQLLVQLGRPAYKRLEFGSFDGILGCVAADIGITLLPRVVVERSPVAASVVTHQIDVNIARAPTFFIRRRQTYEGTALRMFVRCLSDRVQQVPPLFPVSAELAYAH
ncbi:LysR substrate-binding domain-containing protein [Xylophilus sp. GOD-11R]|uniref:LysR substrate-binding domain-containing protein n=1 Tax=Xylophilus sp. GOD-11R TaxID=3089814 RepID=UPI00298D5BBB|nr:LysR substrate-binding domain-containing protein [Xylophilus sp. GOD-11R]WPB55463.1 LysR substrate-binding domain-containing protein [Xylophilus sp. GOD-11R]